jgi:hypothetical protein
LQQTARKAGEQLGGATENLSEKKEVLLEDIGGVIKIIEGNVFVAEMASKISKWCNIN